MYILAECGLIHKYLLKKEDIKRIEEETFLSITIEKNLSDYKVTEIGNKLVFSNSVETLIFNKADTNDKGFIYYLDEFNFEGIKVKLPKDKFKIDKQIKALKAIIPKDNLKDRKIHVQALKELQQHKKKLLNK